MLPFLCSTQPYNRRLGYSVQECKCVCADFPLPGGKCWLLPSSFTLFIKYKATDLTGPLNRSPVSLTVPLSFCVSVSSAMEKLIAEEKRLPVDPCGPLKYNVSSLHRLILRLHSERTLRLQGFYISANTTQSSCPVGDNSRWALQ